MVKLQVIIFLFVCGLIYIFKVLYNANEYVHDIRTTIKFII